jgi:succinyl-diaminopimelate desuccinylase
MTTVPVADPAELLAHTAALVDIPSVSGNEAGMVRWLEAELGAIGGLELTRVGDNLVARTDLGRPRRIVLAGHTDTVPVNGNGQARVVGDELFGVGSADMKGGLALFVEAARAIREPAVDITWVLYAREEIAAEHSGLLELLAERPDLLAGDVAVLGEPTDGAIEAGCQGTMRLRVVLRGARAHTARPWMGRNAIHRLGGLLADLDRYEERQPELQGCRYHEALQAVRVEGGVAGNVVPDRAELVLNHRFAPDRTPAEAEAHVRDVLAPWLEDGDEVEVTELAPAAAPALDHPLIASMIERNSLDVRAKLGWTDVARFASHGIPAVNFGPGDPELAHTADERVSGEQLARTWQALADLLVNGE